MGFPFNARLRVSTKVRVTGQPKDPTTATLTLTLPDGSAQVLDGLNDAVGSWYAFVTASQVGRWVYRWETAGGDADGGAGESWFVVNASETP